MAEQTYELKELAKLLNWNPVHCKVMVKQVGGDPKAPISDEVAARVAAKIRRPWPPQVQAEARAS